MDLQKLGWRDEDDRKRKKEALAKFNGIEPPKSGPDVLPDHPPVDIAKDPSEIPPPAEPIPPRPASDYVQWPYTASVKELAKRLPREKAVELYCTQIRTQQEIATMFNSCGSAVGLLLDEYGIKKRRTGARTGFKTGGAQALLLDNPNRQCRAINERQERCKNFAVKNRQYCRWHLAGAEHKERDDKYKNPLEWAEARRVIDGEAFSLDKHPFLKEIYEWNGEYLVIKKGSQLGVTELALNRAIWFAATGRGNVIYTMPTDGDAAHFVNMRLDPIVDENPTVFRAGNNLVVDNKNMKQVGEKFMLIRGSYTKKSALTIPSDFNIHDELDASSASTINVFKSRLGHSQYRWEMYLGTPTSPKVGIDQKFDETDQRHWYVACPSCGRKIRLCCGYPHLLKTHDDGSHYYGCDKCGTELDRGNGEWAVENPGGKPRGYHVSRLLAPWVSADRLLQEMTGYTSLKESWNQVLGLARASEEHGVTLDVVQGCEDERCRLHVTAPAEALCTAGVDQGAREIFVIVSGISPVGNRQIMWIDKIPIDLAFAQLELLIRQFNIQNMVIDSLPNTASARALALKFPGRIWLCQYKELVKEQIKWVPEEFMVYAARTETLQNMYEDIIWRRTSFPKHEKFDEFKTHLLALVPDRVERGVFNETIIRYVNNGPDHFAHANNYDLIARARTSRRQISISSISSSGTVDDFKAKENLIKALSDIVLEAGEFGRPLLLNYYKIRNAGGTVAGHPDLGPWSGRLAELEMNHSVKKVLAEVWKIMYNSGH
jgi:hypothetical protein